MENTLTKITILEKYSPKTLEGLKLPQRIHNLIESNIDRPGYRMCLFGPAGTGKCLGKNTPILMYDGTIKMVQDVIVGDKLMGLDSTPRNVLSTCTGKEEMYEIQQNKGKNFTCNKSHILSLVKTGNWNRQNNFLPQNIIDMNVEKVFNLNKRHELKLFKVPLIFKEQEILIDPYFLGYWLGDGISIRPTICVGNNDLDSILPYMVKYSEKLNLNITKGNSHNNTTLIRFVANEKYGLNKIPNILNEYLKEYNLINNKHIPKEYLINSRKIRLQLFAGLIDSDGGGGQKDKTYDFCLVNKKLSEDLAWLCRSLGYYVNETIKIIKNKEYYRVMISGNFFELEEFILHKRKIFDIRLINKNELVTGFKIQPLGIGDYYGFEIDGDRRFLLGDFTVTHNTTTARLLNQDRNKFDVLYLSGSNDFNVATLREKVYPFAGSHSVLGKQKTIIVDEAENIRDKEQDSFKIILDSSKKVNFIFITNEIEKMNSAILSRCTQIEYNFQAAELQEQQVNYVKFLQHICVEEKLEHDNTGIKELYIKNFPDFRHSLVILQQLIDSKKSITAENVRATSEIGIQNIELYDLIEKVHDAKTFYEKSTEFKGREKDAINSLAEPYFRYLNSQGKFEQTLKVAVIVAKYSNMLSTSTTKFGTFFALLTELRNVFK